MRSIFRSVLVALVPVFLTMGVGTAMAETYLCVPETAGQTVTSLGGGGTCAAKNTKVELPGTAELATLIKVLPHITYVGEGIDKKPTIQFSGVNVQIVNGEGKTSIVNGKGNLVLGYDENSENRAQTGSHNLILGEQQEFTSYGGILAGFDNAITGALASVTGGESNTSSGPGSSVTGGALNVASAGESSVTDGERNVASGPGSSVTGGKSNTASGREASILGGKELKAEKEYEAIP